MLLAYVASYVVGRVIYNAGYLHGRSDMYNQVLDHVAKINAENLDEELAELSDE